MNLPNSNAELESLSQADLLRLRQEIVDRGKGSPTSLSDDDLTKLVQIFSLLRRRSSGPPKAVSAKKVSAATPLTDLL